MPEQTAPDPLDLLATLEATVATLRDTVRRQEARLARADRRARRRRLPRRALPLLMAALLVALVPLATLAANPFTDLNPGSPHNGNIDLIFNAGITTGCAPTEYCPSDNVTREEMASFLARTAGLGGNPPVANAATAVNATNAQNAGNAGTVGGLAPNGLVRVARGSGTATATDNTSVPVVTIVLIAPAPGFVLVTAGASGRAVDGGEICPCEGLLRLQHVGGATAPFGAMVDIASYAADADEDSGAISYAFPVAAGPQTFRLTGSRINGSANILYSGVGTALYVPFGANGGATIASDEPPPAPPPTRP